MTGVAVFSGVSGCARGGECCGDCVICCLARSSVPSDRLVRSRRRLRRGEFLFRLGHPLQSLYAVRSGTVKTYIFTDDGRVQVTGFHGSGDVLGLGGIAERSYPCEARVVEAAEICELGYDRLEELSAEYPGLGRQLLRLVSREVVASQEHALVLGRLSAEERLASCLLKLARRAGRGQAATELTLAMSRGDLGSYLGLAEETVCRLMARFERDGLIALSRRQMVLQDMDGLARLAQGTRLD